MSSFRQNYARSRPTGADRWPSRADLVWRNIFLYREDAASKPLSAAKPETAARVVSGVLSDGTPFVRNFPNEANMLAWLAQNLLRIDEVNNSV
jgi:hypothetical protein